MTTKGQVTITTEIRARFHIMPNDKVDFFIDGQKAIITPFKTLKQLRGSVAADDSGFIVKEREEAKRDVAERMTEETA